MTYSTMRVGDVIEEIAMGPFGSNIKVDCFVSSGVPVLNGSNLTGFSLTEETFNYVTFEKATSLKKAVASRGDIVITHRGTLGQIVYIPSDSKHVNYVISQSQFRVRCKESVMLPEFMVYLEQMAQAIFTESCNEGETAVLSDILTVCYGKDHKKLSEGQVPCYGSGGIMRYVDESLYSGESVLIPRKGSLNNVLYINEPFWTVDTMFYTHMKCPNVAKFVYFTVRKLDLAGMNVGSAVPSMTTAVLNTLEIVLPSNDNLENFEETVSPMFLQMQANNTESARLAALRDALLPKLMSGELCVAGLDDNK